MRRGTRSTVVAAVADAARRRLILFGGRDADGVALGDTWAFDLDASTWSEISGEQPPARFGVAAAVANAVFHATGKRVRDLPVSLDKLL